MQNVSDGNVNRVFILFGARENESVVLKQSMPYVRVVPSMPLGVRRIYFEHEALKLFHKLSPGSVPKVLGFDPTYACLLLEHLTPYRVLREALINCHQDWDLNKVAKVVAEVAFKTSDLAADYQDKQDLVQLFAGNSEMINLTVEAIFTCPFSKNPVMANNWTSPQLDEVVDRLQCDTALLKGVWELRERFCTYSQALIHADLHTGSLLVLLESEAKGKSIDTRLFDLEFAMFGPIGFDLGVMMANLVMSYLSGGGASISLVHNLWLAFQDRFLEMWRAQVKGSDEKLREFEIMHKSYLRSILQDTVGYAGCEMLRRCIGVAHVEDVLSIDEVGKRAEVEQRILAAGRELVVRREALGKDIATLVAFLEDELKHPEKVSPALRERRLTLVLVSKYPRLGKCKTRLAADLSDETLALKFAQACLADTVERFSSTELELCTGIAKIRRVILVAPGKDIPDFRVWLDASIGKDVSSKWEFLEMSTEEDNRVPVVDLGYSLAKAASVLESATTFIGMDSPELSVKEYVASVKTVIGDVENKTAWISPAFDGGYALLTIPRLEQPRDVFTHVSWSTATAALTQALALTNAGVRVQVGKCFHDVDTLNDLNGLRTRWKQLGPAIPSPSPRVELYLRDLSP